MAHGDWHALHFSCRGLALQGSRTLRALCKWGSRCHRIFFHIVYAYVHVTLRSYGTYLGLLL